MSRRIFPVRAYNRVMRFGLASAVGVCLSALFLFGAKERTPPGHAENASVAVDATAYTDSKNINQALGAELDPYYTAVQVTVTPRKKLNIQNDDFTLLSRRNGEKTRPLAPSQIAGSGTLVLHQVQVGGGVMGQSAGPIWGGIPGTGRMPTRLPGNDGAVGNAGGVTETKASVENGKDKGKVNPLLAVLKEKTLKDQETDQPASGLLIFNLEKQRLKDLVLIYNTPDGPLRIEFK